MFVLSCDSNGFFFLLWVKFYFFLLWVENVNVLLDIFMIGIVCGLCCGC